MARTVAATIPATQFALQAALVALAWVALFRLNSWAFAGGFINPHVSWIFLPAGVRMLSVLVLEWPAVLGLALGTLATSAPGDFSQQLGNTLLVAAISSLGPFLAYRLGRRWMRLDATLTAMRPLHLLAFALLGAAINAIGTNLDQLLVLGQPRFLYLTTAMFSGDLAGMIIMLYAGKVLLSLLDRLLPRLTRQR